MDMKIGTKACAIPNKSGGLRASRAQLPLVPGYCFLWCPATLSELFTNDAENGSVRCESLAKPEA